MCVVPVASLVGFTWQSQEEEEEEEVVCSIMLAASRKILSLRMTSESTELQALMA